jgi:hypothetical protein
MTGLFDRLRAGQSQLTEITSSPKEKAEQPSKNLELLLDWLLHRWPKELVTLRDIQAYGPNAVRDKKVAPNLMHILATRGWVTPVKPHRYDMTRWKIARGSTFQPQPQPTIQPQP